MDGRFIDERVEKRRGRKTKGSRMEQRTCGLLIQVTLLQFSTAARETAATNNTNLNIEREGLLFHLSWEGVCANHTTRCLIVQPTMVGTVLIRRDRSIPAQKLGVTTTALPLLSILPQLRICTEIRTNTVLCTVPIQCPAGFFCDKCPWRNYGDRELLHR